MLSPPPPLLRSAVTTITRAQAVLLGVALVATQLTYQVAWVTGTTVTLTNTDESMFPGLSGSVDPNPLGASVPLLTALLLAGVLYGSRDSPHPGRWLALMALPFAYTAVFWWLGYPQVRPGLNLSCEWGCLT